ncbi:hypothetical protein GCM10011499_24500 [Pelagibacterium lentulum]|uniref:Uncharacterized protein n=1 Tax=Pelagibacterium lentulum TaxID=2029865 RepID=A0A916RES0_9HYPH|nr:hypothetical protein GCM10011499_24500 [Pelagibacterium lentulum]
MRVPSAGPKTSERKARIRRLSKLLAELERLPLHRREAECADVREASIRNLIDELENGYHPIDPPDPLSELLRRDGDDTFPRGN